MTIKIYAAYNKLACELAEKTFTAPNNDVAKNMVENGLYNRNGELDKNQIRNAKHYKLYCLGEYSPRIGLTEYPEWEEVCEFMDCVPTDIQTINNE